MKTSSHPLLLFIFTLLITSSFAGIKSDPPALHASPADIKMFSTFLFTARGEMADGNRVVFAPQYSNGVDGNDAIKLTNPGENFGLIRDGRTLAVEARQPITAGDSIFYSMSNLVPQSYNLMLVPENLDPAGIKCILIDRYLNTQVTVSLRDTNRFVLRVTSDAQSRAANRLIVIFSPLANTEGPVIFTDIVATNHLENVSLSWKVQQETDVDHYELEWSTDSNHFSRISTILPLFNTTDGGSYRYDHLNFEAANNLYRVKSISKNGTVSYSPLARVIVNSPVRSFTVYPNPVTNDVVRLSLTGSQLTTYRIRISNTAGLVVYEKTLQSTTSNFTEELTLGHNLSKGSYVLNVFGDDGTFLTKKLLVQ